MELRHQAKPEVNCNLYLLTTPYDEPVHYTREAWRGRIRASAGVAASLPPERVALFDQEHAELLARSFPAEPLVVPHRVFALVGMRCSS